MVQHGVTLAPSVLEYLTETGEGWAAGLRMAAMSIAGLPNPEQFVKNLSAEDSAVAGYLVQEVLNVQPDLREFLLYSSVLEQVNADIASVLLDRAEVAGALEALARENSFVQPVGDGWYRFHSLFRDVLRLKLRRERPDIVASLHGKAARWYQQQGMLAEAVRSAANTGDWTLAAAIMVDELAIVQLMGPDHGDLPADGFHVVPEGDVSPQFLLAVSAVALSESGDQAAEAPLRAAEAILGRLPEDHDVLSRFAACTLRSSMASVAAASMSWTMRRPRRNGAGPDPAGGAGTAQHAVAQVCRAGASSCGRAIPAEPRIFSAGRQACSRT